MPTYIELMKFTHQGMTNIKGSPARLDAGKEVVRSLGAELRSIYLTLGQYDLVSIIDAPDDATLAKVSIAIASAGNITAESLRAFTEDEYREIIGALP
jgi:uncharacterized protein with GYD domain